MRRDRPGVGQNAESAVAVCKHILTGFCRIMRDSEGADANLPDTEFTAVGVDLVEFTGFRPFTAPQRTCGGPYRYGMVSGERLRPAHMIRMFMRQQQSINVIASQADVTETALQLFPRETAVDQQKRLP